MRERSTYMDKSLILKAAIQPNTDFSDCSKNTAKQVPSWTLNWANFMTQSVPRCLMSLTFFFLFFHPRLERIWLLCETLFLQQCQRWEPFENINTSASGLSSQHHPELWQKYRNSDMTSDASSCLSVLNSAGRDSRGSGWEWWFASAMFTCAKFLRSDINEVIWTRRACTRPLIRKKNILTCVELRVHVRGRRSCVWLSQLDSWPVEGSKTSSRS